MSNKSLLIVASLAYDGIETSEQKVDRTLGGAGSFICLSVKHFECNSSIISVVGNDFHNEDLDLLKSCGIDISGIDICLLYTSPSPRDRSISRMPSSA